MRYIILTLTLLCNLILVSCTDIVNDVPLQNVLEHRNYLSSKSGEEADLFKSYKNIFDNNASTNSKPYIYYYLARVENNKTYLNLGLSKFPDDPYLNLTKTKYFESSFKEENLYKDVLSKHPKFGLALYNLIESKRYSYLFSGKTITDSFFKQNIDNIKELKDLFDGYFNGENNSVHYDFNDINKYGDPEVDSFLKEKYLIMETLYERLENEYKIPNYFLNKKIHTSSKWCENYILISDNMEFKIVDYSSRILYVRDSLVIEGKFLPTGKIEFKNKNSKFLSNGVQKTMLPEYNIYKNSEPSLSQINLSFELIDGKGQTENFLERKIRNHRFSQSTYMLKFSPCEEQKPNNGRKLDKYGESVYVSDVGNTQHPISTTPPSPETIEVVEDEEEVEETIIDSTETDLVEIEEVEGNTNYKFSGQDFYIIAEDIASSEEEAKRLVEILEYEGFEKTGYLWIPDYKSLSGAEYYSVFIGPFLTIDECALEVERYRKSNPSAYGLLVSNKSTERVEIRGPGKITRR